MPTQSIEQHFSHRIEALISDFTGNTLLFFKGFGIQQIQQLIKHPNSLLDDDSLLHDGLLDFAALEQQIHFPRFGCASKSNAVQKLYQCS